MTTYNAAAVDDTVINHKKPGTFQLFRQLRDNMVAALEGASGAPKPALKSATGAFTSGNLDFNSLGAWSGVWFTMGVSNSAGTVNVKFDATDDGGATYLGSIVLTTLVVQQKSITGFFDFATGVLRGVDFAGVINQTIVGASTNIDGIRFTGATGITGAVMIHPNGGESAT